MADGTTTPISDVQPGDLVLATDPETGEHGPRRVTGTWDHDDTLVDLHLDGKVVTTTDDHLFWNHTDQEWEPASALDPGDRLLTFNGDTVTVNHIDVTSAHLGAAYNLTVEGVHTYHVAVGDDEVLVHNDCLQALKNWQSQRYWFGNEQFLLDKKAMTHILQRHHPLYWNRTTAATRTFFGARMSIDDVQAAIGSVLHQNRTTLIERGTNSRFQISGWFNGVEYVLGIRSGRISQFYPLP
jgi:hypothetical protein